MKYDLCGKCAHEMEAAYDVRALDRAKNEKVICARCRKKRYGGRYEVLPKKENK